MCVCVCIYIYIYIYIYLYVCMYVCLYVCLFVCSYVFIYEYMCKHASVKTSLSMKIKEVIVKSYQNYVLLSLHYSSWENVLTRFTQHNNKIGFGNLEIAHVLVDTPKTL